MNSYNYDEILDKIKNFNNSAKKKLIVDISILIKISDLKSDLELVCPYCKSKYIVKNGKNKKVQRYLCKSCKKSFVYSTNTPVACSKKDFSIWLRFIECLINQYSVRKTAKELKISASTAFTWRHKILDAIRENYKCTSLNKKIQCDEMFFQESFKGNHSKDGFVMPRQAHKKSGECRYIGISNEKVCVLTALDSEGNIYISPISMGKPSSNDLIRSIGKKVKENSLFITDSFLPYKVFSSYCKLEHIEIPRYQYVFNNYNTKKVNSLHINIKSFIHIYRGVSTKYLANYLSLFKFIIKNYKECPLLIKGNHPYKTTNFKGRPPIFE